MLANLVENAITHGRPGGRVVVSLDAAPRLALTVADDGPGIPAAERDRVLRHFHRLDAARSQPGSGLGLGLALVAAVAGLHGLDLTLADNPEAASGLPGLHARLEAPASGAPKPVPDGREGRGA